MSDFTLALDPYMLRNTTTLETLPGAVADLGYSYIELSPRRTSRPSSCTRAPTPTR
jgi:myo-inositol catabolism protein IolH